MITKSKSGARFEFEYLGFSFRRAGGTLHVSPASKLTAELREEIKTYKAEILASLDSEVTPEKWHAEAAQAMCKLCHASLQAQGWPEDERSRLALVVLSDRIDAAYLALDMGCLRAEAEGFLVALHSVYPRQQGKTIQYEPMPAGWDNYTGWIRLFGGPWLPIVTEHSDRRACGEFLHDYAQLYKQSDTMVLPAGENPNT